MIACGPMRLGKTELDLQEATAEALKRDEWQPEMSRGIEASDHFHLVTRPAGEAAPPLSAR